MNQEGGRMSCERCEARWCNDECLAYKQGKADERKRIADALDAESGNYDLTDKPSAWVLRFAERLRKGEV